MGESVTVSSREFIVVYLFPSFIFDKCKQKATPMSTG